MNIVGRWENEYQSSLTLAAEGNRLFGLYRSHTGSTGTYLVVGHVADAQPADGSGLPVALAIGWRSLDGGEGDASWHWSSGLGGQMILVDGEELMSLTHCLVGTTAFPGLCPAASYIDKLTYRRTASDGAEMLPSMRGREALPRDPAYGRWRAADGATLDLACFQFADGVGMVTGHWSDGSEQIDLIGTTDIMAASSALPLQSIALAAAGSTARTFAGTIDRAADRLTLTEFVSRSTSASAIYLQTAITSRIYDRIGQVQST